MLELDHSESIYSKYLMNKFKGYITSLTKDETKILEQFLQDTIKETNPRATEKAIELMHNNCSAELVTPFIGYTNYSNLLSYFTASMRCRIHLRSNSAVLCGQGGLRICCKG